MTRAPFSPSAGHRIPEEWHENGDREERDLRHPRELRGETDEPKQNDEGRERDPSANAESDRDRRPLTRGHDADDAVATPVTRGDEQRTVGSRRRGTKTSVFLIEKDLALRHMRAVDGESPEVLLLERRDDERAGPWAPLGS